MNSQMPKFLTLVEAPQRTDSARKSVPRLEFEPGNEEFLRYLENNHQQRLFQTPANIIYQGHVPLAAYFVLGGTLEVKRGKRLVDLIEGKNIIIGAKELFYNIEYPFSVRVQTPTKVYILSRSILEEAMAHGQLPHLVQELKHN